ncbi:MAG: MgtC/SapB family protein [Tyzzerella sp.]|nr:MgtC/SapB family protein [Tyzzerella sp.]
MNDFMNIQWQDILDAFIKMAMALFCGGVLGIERGRKKRPAGFRTYMLVCLGATLVMMTNDYICQIYGTGDVARMGAQVVNGIGFLGAGTIITTGHNRVKGLTTAAGLWASACIGLAIGSSYYVGALMGTFMIFIIMVVLHSFDRRLLSSTKVVVLYVEMKKMSVIRRLNAFAKEHNIIVDDVEMETPDPTRSSRVAALVSLRLPKKSAHAELIDQINAIEGVHYAEEM